MRLSKDELATAAKGLYMGPSTDASEALAKRFAQELYKRDAESYRVLLRSAMVYPILPEKKKT